MKQNYRISYLLLLCLGIVTSLMAQNEIAVIAKTVGTVTYQYKEQTSWQALKAGTLLFDKAVIRTASDGFATLIYLDDKSRVTIRPKSELTISGSFRKEQIEKKVQMKHGEAVFEVAKEKRRFKVETPTSVASVKGTKFFTVVSKDDSSSVIYGISGLVGVHGTSGAKPSDTVSVVVSRMKKAIVPLGGSAILDTLSKEEFDQLLELLENTEKSIHSEAMQHEVTLTTSDGGAVHPDGATTLYDNAPMEIQAYPNASHQFIRWQISKGQAFIKNPYHTQSTLFLNGSNATVKAIFSENSTPALITNLEGGSVIPQGVIRVQKDSSVEIKALPTKGYIFKAWEGDNSASITDLSSSITTVSFSDSGEVRAHFVKDTSAIKETDVTDHSDSLECVLIIDGKGKISPKGSIIVKSGEEVALSADPRKGYLFSHWMVTAGNAVIDSPTVAQTTAKLFSSNAFIKAVFTKEKESCTITIRETEGGTTTPTGTLLLSPFESGTFTATANEGYQFAEWQLSSVGANFLLQYPSDSQLSIQPISGTISITPHFERTTDSLIETPEDTSRVRLLLSDDGNCSIKGEHNRELRKGRKTTLRTEIFPGFTFDRWEVLSGTVVLESPKEPYTKIEVNSSARIKARTIPLKQIKVRMSQSDGASKELNINYIDLK